MDLRPVLYIVGIFLSILAVSMTIPMLADLYTNNPDWKVFLLCGIITAFFGGALILTNSSPTGFHITVRQVFLLTCACWGSLATMGALPFWMSELRLSYTDAFFESMSGITTTGSTVITGLDNAPPGILIWRALLQWLGGIGIIIMALSVLPFLKVGGMQIFRTELSENEKALPRVAQLASSIGMIYLILTILCAIFFMFSGLSFFDSVAHAMTTISTGGFSTTDASFSKHIHPGAETVATIFMLIGSLPFVLYLKGVNGNFSALFRDSQVRWFLSIVTVATIATTVFLATQMDLPFWESFRRSSFNVVSLITGTGFVNGDYNLWGGFAVSLFFFLMAVGGCAGSTSCGIKIFRFQVLHTVTVTQMKQLLHPNGVFIPRYNDKPLARDASASVMSFFFMYALCFTALAISLSFVGLDFLTAMSGAVTSISNVGPGLGDIIGPSGTFAPLPDSAKWILSIGMFMGRLEIFTLLVLFTPQFWKK